MLYPQNREPFREETFISPPAAYRGVPFWAWNCRVTEEKIDRQTECFHEMGMGGAMVHPRTGMDTAYLSEEYMALVRHAEESLNRKGMACWLYDEERFPSGCAGGIVTRDARYRARYIVVTDQPAQGYCADRAEFDRRVAAGEKPRGYFLCEYRVEWTDGRLSSYERMPSGERTPSGGNRRAYVELMAESPWFNGETYVDVFNSEAVDEFLRVTHEAYAAALGEAFGRTVPAIFTDEPHMKGKYCLPNALAGRATLAYTDDMNDTFRARYGRELLDILPELIWELPEGAYSPWRYRYHEHVTERFAAAYGDRIGAWCAAHHIAYTGHFLSERTLYSQTLALGESMRQYRAQQLPGVDILAGQLEITTVKQAESVRRQMGREGLVCEMYGVLEWDVAFRQHKLQGDWLAALGVTVRVHHLAFMGMGGEAKRDWPAAIGWQSPWWNQYAYLEDYFARVNTLLTRGKPVVRVAVVHPIESFWLLFGPNDQTLARREQMDAQFENLAQWLLYGGIDYDYLSESTLPGLCSEGGCPLRVGECAYDAVIVPPVITLRGSTLERLAAFRAAGGCLILLGDMPRLIDGLPSEAARGLWEAGRRVPMERAALMEALGDQRDLEIREKNGRLADNLFYQLRQDGEERTLFICHVRDDTPARPREYSIRMKGLWKARRMDAVDGSISDMGGVQENGDTIFTWACDAQDSVLLRLTMGVCAPPQTPGKAPRVIGRWSETEDFTLEEPNALLLDRCEYALDEGAAQGPDDILRADNALRAQAGLPMRDGDQVQPWLTPEEKAEHSVTLKYCFFSDEAFSGLSLAMEQVERARLWLNGEELSAAPTGWYVDEDIKTLPLPPLRAGENELILRAPLTRRSNLENIYVLGNFGVRVAGTRMTLEKPPRRMATDDLTRQGLPFYTGNARLRFPLEVKEDSPELYVHIPHMACPVARVSVDGREAGKIAWQPNRVKLPRLTAGEHVIEVTAFGSRYNGFGTLHNANPNYKWYGPNAWRTTGDEWTDCYLTRPSGILSPIELMEEV